MTRPLLRGRQVITRPGVAERAAQGQGPLIRESGMAATREGDMLKGKIRSLFFSLLNWAFGIDPVAVILFSSIGDY